MFVITGKGVNRRKSHLFRDLVQRSVGITHVLFRDIQEDIINILFDFAVAVFLKEAVFEFSSCKIEFFRQNVNI